jgi:hypothetical protein
MRRLLFISLVTSTLIVAANDDFSPENVQNFSPPISQEFFETCKKRLHSIELREFVEDFANWPPEEKNMVTVFDWHIAIDGLSAERYGRHQDSFWHWMVCDNGRSIRKHRLGICLVYLKNQK